jgi:hypothetical protein
MAGWSHDKRNKFEDNFFQFLNSCYINSKNTGFTCLGEHLYDGQLRFINTVLDGLEEDIHKFYVLKSRQLGLSTISRALSVFYIGIHRGLGGALVFDSSENRDNARDELEAMIDDLPAKLKYPSVKSSNRYGIFLANKSKILFKAAGVKKTAQTGGLGRSVGLSMSHMSELCSYSDPDGLEAFENSLSDENPDRLYIYESTARGYNLWNTIWEEARKDPTHCSCLFLGWWSHPKQRIDESQPDFELYGRVPPSAKEAEKIRQVRELYGVEITMPQLAWIRRRMDPGARQEGDAEPEFEGSTIKIQEQPWIESEAFQQTGSIFFSDEKLTEVTNKDVSPNFKSYFYSVGAEFVNTIIIKAPTAKMAELKVWEEPDPDGTYAIGVDPAFGENELNDRSSIEILRCYADGVDQVAEYASPLVRTQQLAWILASLMGWYGQGTNSKVYYALELNGPGMPVFDELRSLKRQIEMHSYLDKQLEEQGLKNVFRNVRNYLYSRPDAVQGSFALHLKTNSMLKVRFMERLRDFTSNGMLKIRSMDLVTEMKSIAREGDTIKAAGTKKDDRVLAAAFAVHCWEQGPRKLLMSSNRTREAEAARQRLTIVDQVNLFQSHQLQHFFDQKRRARVDIHREMMKRSWRNR